MGYHRVHLASGQGVEDFFRQELSDNEIPVLASAVADDVYYAAVRDGDAVRAIIIRFWQEDGASEHTLAYEPMDERKAPPHHGCPPGVLAHLTPTGHSRALEWRRNCRLAARGQGAPGDMAAAHLAATRDAPLPVRKRVGFTDWFELADDHPAAVHLPLVELTPVEWADYQRACARWDAWQDRLGSRDWVDAHRVPGEAPGQS